MIGGFGITGIKCALLVDREVLASLLLVVRHVSLSDGDLVMHLVVHRVRVSHVLSVWSHVDRVELVVPTTTSGVESTSTLGEGLSSFSSFGYWDRFIVLLFTFKEGKSFVKVSVLGEDVEATVEDERKYSNGNID